MKIEVTRSYPGLVPEPQFTIWRDGNISGDANMYFKVALARLMALGYSQEEANIMLVSAPEKSLEYLAE